MSPLSAGPRDSGPRSEPEETQIESTTSVCADPELAPLDQLLAVDPRRADARRNGERIIAAALEVLAERGFDAGMSEIAARAGVGKATVYRLFPTKPALLTAVVAHRCSVMAAELTHARGEPDAAAALRRVVNDLFTRRAHDRLVLDALKAHSTPETEAAVACVVELLDDLLQAAQRAGTVRPDVNVAELRLLLGGCTQQLSQLGESDPAVWQHYADLVLDALRPVSG